MVFAGISNPFRPVPLSDRRVPAHESNRAAKNDRWDRSMLFGVRAVVLMMLVYATWHYGGVHTVAQHRLCWFAFAGLLLAIGTQRCWQYQRVAIPKYFLLLALAWIVYAILQSAPGTGMLDVWFHRAHQQSTPFIERTGELVVAAEALGYQAQRDASLEFAATARGSSVAHATRLATVPYMLALAVAVLTAIGFQSRRSRSFLLSAVVLNAAVLAVWGIIQRAGGGEQILPGVEQQFRGVPFASFIYKNAGAAALLPAIAAAAGLAMIGSSTRRSASCPPQNFSTQAGGNTHWNQLRTIRLPMLLFLSGLIVAGLIASLSRGAWLTLLITLLAVGVFSGVSLRNSRTWMAVCGIAALLIAVTLTSGITEDIKTRAGQVSLGRVSADQRWGQWVDGFQTALANLPSGSGLGTYGYASLPHQSEARDYWFREAHNQYLEVFTETGIVGVLIVFCGIVWFARLALDMIRRGAKDQSQSMRGWGMIGIALLMFAAIHSIVDFVIKIPANLICYSILITAVAVTRSRRADRGNNASHRASTSGLRERLVAGGNYAVTWAFLGLLVVAFAARGTKHQLIGDAALAASQVTDSSEHLSDQWLEPRIALLNDAIARQPLRSQLHYRSAQLRLLQYRTGLLAMAGDQGIPLTADQTRIEMLHAQFMSSPSSVRRSIHNQCTSTPRLRYSMARSLLDLRRSILCNPYDPQSHLFCALTSPLVGTSTRGWIETSSALASNNGEILFHNGLMAYFAGDRQRMIDQWSKALSIGRDEHRKIILNLSSERISLPEMAEQMIPPDHPEWIVDLLRLRMDDPAQTTANLEGRALLDYFQRQSQLDPLARHVTLARINDLLGRSDDGISHWKAAILLSPMDARVRLGLTTSLQESGEIDEALDQAVLGQRLFPEDSRFERLAVSIRREIGNRH